MVMELNSWKYFEPLTKEFALSTLLLIINYSIPITKTCNILTHHLFSCIPHIVMLAYLHTLLCFEIRPSKLCGLPNVV